jgi:hypothetical protein
MTCENAMFNLSRAMQAIDEVMGSPDPKSLAATWNTPVQFDPDLTRQLIARHDELDVRFAALVRRLAADPPFGERAVLECADRLHKLRHTESLKLYPVIARGLSPDPIARRLFWQSRLVTLGLARRVLRRFDELARAVRNHSEVAAAAEHVTSALVEYRRRNESTMYPLYIAVGQHEAAARSRVA